MNRLTQASSFAGYGLIFQGLSQLFTTKFADPAAYGLVIAGIAAIVKNEGTN
jgi:hypothetical protein